MTINNYYETTDAAITAFLSLFFPIDSMDRRNPQRIIFYFKRTSEIDKLIELYWRKEIKVDPQDYYQAIKILKSRIREY